MEESKYIYIHEDEMGWETKKIYADGNKALEDAHSDWNDGDCGNIKVSVLKVKPGVCLNLPDGFTTHWTVNPKDEEELNNFISKCKEINQLELIYHEQHI